MRSRSRRAQRERITSPRDVGLPAQRDVQRRWLSRERDVSGRWLVLHRRQRNPRVRLAEQGKRSLNDGWRVIVPQPNERRRAFKSLARLVVTPRRRRWTATSFRCHRCRAAPLPRRRVTFLPPLPHRHRRRLGLQLPWLRRREPLAGMRGDERVRHLLPVPRVPPRHLGVVPHRVLGAQERLARNERLRRLLQIGYVGEIARNALPGEPIKDPLWCLPAFGLR